MSEVVHPAAWLPAAGYAAGRVAEGRLLSVGGQVGWSDDEVFESDELVEQFEQALRNVRAVVEAAGGQVTHLTRLTIFLTDMAGYRANQKGVAEAWDRVMGRHYPTLSFVGVTDLLEAEALVEIQGLAVLPTAQS